MAGVAYVKLHWPPTVCDMCESKDILVIGAELYECNTCKRVLVGKTEFVGANIIPLNANDDSA